MKTKQVIVVRTLYPDGKGGNKRIRTGKLIAQACHASMAFLSRQIEPEEDSPSATCDCVPLIVHVAVSKVQMDWCQNSFAKVCVYVETEAELAAIEAKAKEKGIVCHVVEDNGVTEFNGVKTKTCLALGPDLSEKIDEVTGNLPLY
jgi:PTH2 family peptidyl-tRNA hydrolase